MLTWIYACWRVNFVVAQRRTAVSGSIEQGLRERGINPTKWHISPIDSPLPGTTRIVGQRELLVLEDGRQYVYFDVWTLILRDGIPLWESFGPTRQKIILPKPIEMQFVEN
jgi:hypothetical protein